MKFCKKCGCKVMDNDQFCKVCGSKLDENNVGSFYTDPTMPESNKGKEDQVLAICALIFSIVSSLVGLILAIVGLKTYKQDDNRKKCKIALLIAIIKLALSVVWIVISIISAFVRYQSIQGGYSYPIYCTLLSLF